MKTDGARDCPYAEHLFGYVDETLPRRLRRATDRHLQQCTICQSLLAGARELQRFQSRLGAVDTGGWGPRETRRWTLQVRPSASGAEVEAVSSPSPPAAHGLTFLRVLARGGCADVWLARDPAGVVVVKVVRKRFTEEELDALRLYKALADDPELRLVPIHQIAHCEQSGRLYYTMSPADPLDGRALDADSYIPATLEAASARAGGLSLGEVQALAGEVLESLERLHAKGLVHRDVKPSNLLRHHGRWCLADTGLLAREDGLAGRPLAGTPEYMPREGRNHDRGSDLYAFGRTLYEAVTQNLDSFPAPRPEHLREIRGRAPWRRFYRVIERACATDPQRRYASARQMLQDLSGQGSGRRQRVVVGGVAALVIFAALAVTWRVATRTDPGPASAAVLTSEPRILVQPPDGSAVALAWGQSMVPGWSLWVEAALPSGQQHALVLAWYVGETRSVYQFAPERRELQGDGSLHCEFGYGLDDDGNLVGFEIPDEPSPVLVLVLSQDEPFAPQEAEKMVEELLGSVVQWPATRNSGDRAPHARVAHAGIRYSVVHPVARPTDRGGVQPGAGQTVRRLDGRLQLLVDRLADQGMSVSGRLLTIAAARTGS